MRTIHSSILALSLVALVGCKAIDAMDNTSDMKQNLGDMKSTTQGMATTTTNMDSNMQDLKRRATLGEGLKMLDDPENNREYAPPSAGLLAGAKLLAENMTQDELVDFFVVRLKEINATGPSPLEKDSSLSGYSPAYIYNFNKAKQVKVVGLEAIAAQIPQKEPASGTVSIEALIRDQIYGAGGARSDEVIALLQLRALFIQNFFLDSNVFAAGKKLNNLGKLRKAYGYAKDLKFIADLPFVDSIAFATESTAFIPTVYPPAKKHGEEGCKKDEEIAANPECQNSSAVPSFNDKFKEKIAPADWFSKISARIDSQMPESFTAANSPYAAEIAAIKADCDKNSGE
ncbi:MAG: hypothetical protein ACXWQO_16805 [Bdellovibrionota bacterium]